MLITIPDGSSGTVNSNPVPVLSNFRSILLASPETVKYALPSGGCITSWSRYPQMCIRDRTNPKIAQIIITQFGGPDGELAASMRYLSQRYTMPYKEVTGILTDIGTEELAHR